MPDHTQIDIPSNIEGLIRHLVTELPALVGSGAAWEVAINGTKEGRVFYKIERRGALDPAGRVDSRRLIERR